MSRHPHAIAPDLIRRFAVALAGVLLQFALGPAAPGPTSPVQADELVVRDDGTPDVRIQIIITQVRIADDRDPGEGEIRLHWVLAECLETGCSVICTDKECSSDGPILGHAQFGFHANSGETVTLSQLANTFPGSGGTLADGVSESAGFPLHADKRYKFVLIGHELDYPFTRSDLMGVVDRRIDKATNWGIGTYRERSDRGDRLGDFAVDYEVRRVSLPDLAPSNIRIIDPGGQEFYCVTVDNVGQRPSGAFRMAVRADDTLVTTFDVSAVGVGQSMERCIIRSNLPPGEHILSFVVDEAREIAEMNELNNEYEYRIPARRSTAAGPQPLVGPTVADPSAPPPAAVQSDLAVKAIRVRGEDPGGQSHCDPGRNDIVVVVKNQGAGAAGSFVVRVQVDDDDEAEETVVAALDAGKELDVRFDDIRLKKGERELTATADVKKAIAESDEGNNELRATVKCKDEGD